MDVVALPYQDLQENSQALLTHLRDVTGAAMICLFAPEDDQPSEWSFVAYQAPYARTPDEDAFLCDVLHPWGMRVNNAQPLYIPSHQLAETGFVAAALLPLINKDALNEGLVVLLYEQPVQPFDAQTLRVCQPWLNMLEALLENRRLREERRLSQALQTLVAAFSNNVTLYEALEQLRAQAFFPVHVVEYALLFYGPLPDDNLELQREYLELQAVWSHLNGAMDGRGIRLSLETYQDLLAQIEQQNVLELNVEQLIEISDPLVRGLIRAVNPARLLFISLHAKQTPLGLLVLGTDQDKAFTKREIETYRKLGEFVAIHSAMLHLQRQHELVEQARAALLDSVTDGVMMVAPSSNLQSGYVLTVNASFSQLFNVSPQHAQGIALVDMLNRMQIRQDVRAALLEEWTTIPLSYPFQQNNEFEMTHPEGYPIVIEWYSAPVYQAHNLIGRIYTFHDASQSRVAARLRADFVRRLAHELRTPLTSIQGFAELLNLQQENRANADYIKIIRQSVQHLNSIVNQMIEGARAESGELELTKTLLNLPELIESAKLLLKSAPEKRRQRIEVQVEPNYPPVMGDTNRILQVLYHLLDNASKFSPEQSTITIQLSVLDHNQLRDSAPADVITPAVLVEVADEGPGILPEERALIFTPFYRTSEARAMQAVGSGLGLTISRGIIEAHRGKMWAEGRRKGRKGARFLFTLPLPSQPTDVA